MCWNRRVQRYVNKLPCGTVRHEGVWNPESGKHRVQTLNYHWWCGGLHSKSLYPFGVSVNQNQKHVTLNWSHKFYMQPRPWLGRPFSGLQRGLCRYWLTLLALQAALHHHLNIIIHLGPPDKHSGQALLPSYPRMASMKLLQYPLSSRVGHDHPISLKNSPILHW